MAPAPQLRAGLQVIVVHADDPENRWLIGHTGVIDHELDAFEGLITGFQWAVDLPDAEGRPCPRCGVVHDGSIWLFNSHELKPFTDPDGDIERTTDEQLPEELHA